MISDEEWSLIVSYLLLMKKDAEQRHHDLKALFNGLRHVIRYGIACRKICPVVCGLSTITSLDGGGMFRGCCPRLRTVLRLSAGKQAEPTTTIIDSRALSSTSESGLRTGYDGAKRKKGSKLHMEVNTLEHLLTCTLPSQTETTGQGVGPPAEAIQQATDSSVELVWAGSKAANAAKEHDITLEIIRLPQVKWGFILLPYRWIVEQSFA